eukprot:92564-Chlamydomonas_euryale.AAC.2
MSAVNPLACTAASSSDAACTHARTHAHAQVASEGAGSAAPSARPRGFGKKGKGKGGAKSGRAPVSPAAKNELAELQWQTITTRQALNKTNSEVAR